MLKGHPPATYVLCFTEALERFSYYTMSGLLALFLAGSTASGGLGWPTETAIHFYGTYVAILWLMPLAGGWIADRLLGARRAVYTGGLMIAVGQALMLTPAIYVPAIGSVYDLPLAQAFREAGVALGYLQMPADAEQRLLGALAAASGGLAPTNGDLAAIVRNAYLVPAFAFMLGLGVLAIGNGMLKPNITVMLGHLYDARDTRRDEGFTLFYIAINVGAVLSALVAGTIAERFGWAFGFGVASAVMLAGILALYMRRSLLPRGLGDRPSGTAASALQRSPIPRRPLAYVVILMLFATVFWAAFMQTYGLLNIVTYRDVDRDILGFTVPAAWFTSLTPFFLIMLGPLFQTALRALDRRGLLPGTLGRFIGGLVIAAIAFFFLAAALWTRTPGVLVSMIWPISFYLLLSVAELSLSPAGNAMASRHVPPESSGRLMAIWFLCYAGGSLLSGIAGGLVASYPVEIVLAGMGVALVVSAVLMRAIAAPINRLVEPPPPARLRPAEAAAP